MQFLNALDVMKITAKNVMKYYILLMHLKIIKIKKLNIKLDFWIKITILIEKKCKKLIIFIHLNFLKVAKGKLKFY